MIAVNKKAGFANSFEAVIGEIETEHQKSESLRKTIKAPTGKSFSKNWTKAWKLCSIDPNGEQGHIVKKSAVV